MKTKLTAMLLTLAMLLSLSACGGGNTGEPEAAAPETQETPAATPALPAETEEPAEPEPAPEPAPESRTAEEGVAGVYKLTTLTENGEEVEDLKELEEMGLVAYLVLEEDGTGAMEIFGEKDNVRWDEKYIYSAEEDEEVEPSAYTYSGGVLSLEEDGAVMAFTKLTEEELKNYEENGSGGLEDFLGALSESDLPAGEPSEGPVSGTVEGCAVTVLGAESFEEDGKDYLRIYYDFTNGTEEDNSAFMVLYFEAAQNGRRLESVVGMDNAVAEDENDMEDIAPGETIRCTEIYEFTPEDGVVAFCASDLMEEETVLYYADPANLTGAP